MIPGQKAYDDVLLVMQRAVFHEITESAIRKAFEEPRDIDYNLVSAQETRRILDKIVGFSLSPVLWRHVSPRLSAGRVQSCGLNLIAEVSERHISRRGGRGCNDGGTWPGGGP